MRFELPGVWRNPHVQTIWAAKVARRPRVAWRREVWRTPDGDQLLATWAGAPADNTRSVLVLFHGLEGCAESHYAQAFAAEAVARGWDCVLPHFRGCGGMPNLMPRAYHSGDHIEIDWLLQRVAERYPDRPRVAAGVSLGGNALMLWAGVQAQVAKSRVRAIASVCSPLDLMASGAALEQGACRWIYTPMFLRTMRRKAVDKHRQFPGLFDVRKAVAANTLREFDDVFTGPVHGFAGLEHYWTSASAKHRMGDITVPALALNAEDDPFVPVSSLPRSSDVGSSVVLAHTRHGGHVGYPRWQGDWRGDVGWMPSVVCDWLSPHMSDEDRHG